MEMRPLPLRLVCCLFTIKSALLPSKLVWEPLIKILHIQKRWTVNDGWSDLYFAPTGESVGSLKKIIRNPYCRYGEYYIDSRTHGLGDHHHEVLDQLDPVKKSSCDHGELVRKSLQPMRALSLSSERNGDQEPTIEVGALPSILVQRSKRRQTIY